MKHFAWALLALLPATALAAEPSSIVFVLKGEEAVNLRVKVTVDGRSPDVAWEAFLKLYLAYFDTDDSHTLSRAEAERALSLPSADGQERALEFDRLDANRDGQASESELRAYCRGSGFAAVSAASHGPSLLDEQLGSLFQTALDADRDGRITREELVRAPRALRKFDLNEDESLELRELADPAKSDSRKADPIVVRDETAEGTIELRLAAGAKPAVEADGGALKILASGRFLLTVPKSDAVLFGSAARRLPNVKSSGEFLLAQLQSAAKNDHVARSATADDPALAGLLDLFPFADRDRNEKLSVAELQAWLELIESGLAAQVRVELGDHGCNVFPLLDADADGRLSSLELAGASESCKQSNGRLPHTWQLQCSAPAVRTWGGVTIPALKPSPIASMKRSSGPRWFQALDQNADGLVSAREFLGPPAAFQRLDYNGDQLIQPDEAERQK